MHPRNRIVIGIKGTWVVGNRKVGAMMVALPSGSCAISSVKSIIPPGKCHILRLRVILWCMLEMRRDGLSCAEANGWLSSSLISWSEYHPGQWYDRICSQLAEAAGESAQEVRMSVSDLPGSMPQLLNA
jgi:hypothetical protein